MSKDFDAARKLIGEVLSGPAREQVWDLLVALRGPDWPSERSDQSPTQHSSSYNARRKRKYKTVEVIRAAAFGGIIGGSARFHKSDHVILPPKVEWDHFDKHVAKAAKLLGLKIVIEERNNLHVPMPFGVQEGDEGELLEAITPPSVPSKVTTGGTYGVAPSAYWVGVDGKTVGGTLEELAQAVAEEEEDVDPVEEEFEDDPEEKDADEGN